MAVPVAHKYTLIPVCAITCFQEQGFLLNLLLNITTVQIECVLYSNWRSINVVLLCSK
jgi:hypothetical protein